MSFAPGHISLTFAIWPDSDLLAMGSTGVGIVLPQGVHCAAVREQSEIKHNVVIREGTSVEDPVTLRALELLGFANKGLTVYLRHDLPLGSGFGISGASALAACMELEKNLDLCVKAAHQAEQKYQLERPGRLDKDSTYDDKECSDSGRFGAYMHSGIDIRHSQQPNRRDEERHYTHKDKEKTYDCHLLYPFLDKSSKDSRPQKANHTKDQCHIQIDRSLKIKRQNYKNRDTDHTERIKSDNTVTERRAFEKSYQYQKH